MPKIGKANRVGNVGKASKRKGVIGKTNTAYGSALHTTLGTRAKVLYPTTTTA